MKRTPGWQGRLAKCISTHARGAHVWGERDCALGLVVPCIEAMTGEDVGAPYRGQYSTLMGATLALKRAGFDDLRAVAASHFKAIHHSEARLGDIAVIENEDGTQSYGIFIGEMIAGLGIDGMGMVPRARANPAYRVG